jgi:hypothetical protein
MENQGAAKFLSSKKGMFPGERLTEQIVDQAELLSVMFKGDECQMTCLQARGAPSNMRSPGNIRSVDVRTAKP